MNFWDQGSLGTHIDALKPKNSRLTFTVRGGFFTFWTILVHSAALLTLLCTNNHISLANGLTHKPDDKLEKAHIYLEKKEKNVKSRVG